MGTKRSARRAIGKGAAAVATGATAAQYIKPGLRGLGVSKAFGQTIGSPGGGGNNPPPPPALCGKFSVGGQFDCEVHAGTHIYVGSAIDLQQSGILRCNCPADLAGGADSLQVGWQEHGTNAHSTFHLDTITYRNCTNVLGYGADNPVNSPDTIQIIGTGSVNFAGVGGAAESGYTIEATYGDAGEQGGANDVTEIRIYKTIEGPVAGLVLYCKSTTLQNGNYQFLP